MAWDPLVQGMRSSAVEEEYSGDKPWDAFGGAFGRVAAEAELLEKRLPKVSELVLGLRAALASQRQRLLDPAAIDKRLARWSAVKEVSQPKRARATSGDVLLEPDAIATLIAELIPRADLLTPNLPEAGRLLGAGEATSEADMVTQGRAICALGAKAVLIKGGHGAGAEAVDVLVSAAGVARFASPRIETIHTHGTGCTLSAAIAAGLASGLPLAEAISRAKRYVSGALEAGRSIGVGKGRGPLDHAFKTRDHPCSR